MAGRSPSHWFGWDWTLVPWGRPVDPGRAASTLSLFGSQKCEKTGLMALWRTTTYEQALSSVIWLFYLYWHVHAIPTRCTLFTMNISWRSTSLERSGCQWYIMMQALTIFKPYSIFYLCHVGVVIKIDQNISRSNVKYTSGSCFIPKGPLDGGISEGCESNIPWLAAVEPFPELEYGMGKT
jgi:hypothetical protein